MKKVLLMVAIVATALFANAQTEVGSISITPKVGAAFTTLTDVDGGDMKFGFVGGAEAEYRFAEKFDVSAGLLFSMQGIKFNNDSYKLNYINVPILASYEVFSNFKVKAGLQPGFLLSAKYGKTDVKDGCKSFDLSIPVGVSYEISNIVVDARYNFGFTKAFKDGDSKNSVIMLTVGYKFSL